MSVRKRKWRTRSGDELEAWVVDYSDTEGVRHLKTFKLKKDAETFEAEARQQILAGTHVPHFKSKTVAEAGALWLATAKGAELGRATILLYEELLRLHIVPFIGSMKLAQLSVPVVRAFEDKLKEKGRSPSMVARVLVALGSILADAQDRGLTVHNAVRERGRSRRGKKKSKIRKR